MDAFVALTGLDETNIILAMYASQLNHCKVVAKINRKSFADVVTERGLVDSLVSTGAVTTELIVQYVRAMQNSQATNVRTLHRLVGGKVEALEFGVTADVPFAGVPLRDLNLRKKYPCGGHYPRKRQDDYPVRQRFFLCRGRCDHCYHQHRSDRSARYYGKGVTE